MSEKKIYGVVKEEEILDISFDDINSTETISNENTPIEENLNNLNSNNNEEINKTNIDNIPNNQKPKKIYGVVKEEEVVEISFDNINVTNETSINESVKNLENEQLDTKKEIDTPVSEANQVNLENEQPLDKKEEIDTPVSKANQVNLENDQPLDTKEEIDTPESEQVQLEKNHNKKQKKVYGVVKEEKPIEIPIGDNSIDNNEPKVFGTVPNYKNLNGFDKKKNTSKIKAKRKINKKNVICYMLMGLIGSLIAYIITIYTTQNIIITSEFNFKNIFINGLNYAIYGFFIAGFIACAEDFKIFHIKKFFRHFLTTGFIGFITGSLGGIISHVIIHTKYSNDYLEIFSKIISLTLIGIFIGISQCFTDFKYNKKKLKNGFLGGFIGIILYIILLNVLNIIHIFNIKDEIYILLRMLFIGASIGGYIGLISEKSKEAIVYILDGNLKGKEFSLYEPITSFGSDFKASISIREENILPIHFSIENNVTHYTLVSKGATLVNGINTNLHKLNSGDTIQMGNTIFKFEEYTLGDNNE